MGLASRADRAVKGAIDPSLRPHQYTYVVNGQVLFRERATPHSVRGYAPMGVQGLLDILGVSYSGTPITSRQGRQTRYLWEGKLGWFMIIVEPFKLTFEPTHRLQYYFLGKLCFTEKATSATPTGADNFLAGMGYQPQGELPRERFEGGIIKVQIPLMHPTRGQELLVVRMEPLR